ncbi:MAG: hypothetical protein CO066_10620 [Comamonadaceae bacterium CG_4_9_14_0_8_um_filter_60_18]|nr:hypothetical protein [Rhodoferax sp.]OIP25383.1 MAG: hypothetical protein AUK52_00615 [Comamonadaceae bacterium CG2_30_60_41]PIW09309.1 MAG: hypothetical protein COW39_05520 [Comamonadaceae bacterium CG17_big_fil_post_rev_8_21_14_2_50_60_13]PIY26127.1 MAG: hypothetical protein COZ10_03325 [Comamonadaceae bacterium CG_4_10_14_3_um_filter_60_75]PJC12376.1 MAG: hypothetical protein CO066_10620 [Comamonadaceae bacterium CG_4_9_14_0_8_um_filter_60_18]
MQGAKRAVQLCCTSDLQRSRTPKAGSPAAVDHHKHYVLEDRGLVDLKDKGLTKTYALKQPLETTSG